MEKDCHRALDPSFTYGCGSCVFKHNICGDQLEVPDCMFDSPDFLSLECLATLRCPPMMSAQNTHHIPAFDRFFASFHLVISAFIVVYLILGFCAFQVKKAEFGSCVGI